MTPGVSCIVQCASPWFCLVVSQCLGAAYKGARACGVQLDTHIYNWKHLIMSVQSAHMWWWLQSYMYVFSQDLKTNTAPSSVISLGPSFLQGSPFDTTQCCCSRLISQCHWCILADATGWPVPKSFACMTVGLRHLGIQKDHNWQNGDFVHSLGQCLKAIFTHDAPKDV